MDPNEHVNASELEFQSILNSVPVLPSTPPVSSVPGSSKRSSLRFLDPYRPYFDIDNKTVFSRITQAAHPLNRNFLVDLDNPDLYGPFWLSFTVPFVMMVLGNVSVWLRAGSKWEFHFLPFLVCVLFTGICVFAVPFGYSWFASFYIVPAGVIQVVCLLGYSTTLMIPTAGLCFIVRSGLDWLVAVIGGLVAAFSVFRKLQYPFDVMQTAGRAFLPNLLLAAVVWLNAIVCYGWLFR